jgi:hypothetical protein
MVASATVCLILYWDRPTLYDLEHAANHQIEIFDKDRVIPTTSTYCYRHRYLGEQQVHTEEAVALFEELKTMSSHSHELLGRMKTQEQCESMVIYGV